MAHSPVCGYLLIQKRNKNAKKLAEEKLSENGVSIYKSLGELIWTIERK